MAYLGAGQLELQLGLLARLVMGDNMFVEQFGQSIDSLRVSHSI